jgi:DNA-binding LytR/AlgR family response regulator
MESIYIPAESGFCRVRFNSILYVEEVADDVHLVTSKNIFVLSVSLKAIEWLFPQKSFCKTHPLFIVNLEAVIGFDEGKVFIENGEIPMHARFRDKLMKRLNILINDDAEDTVELMSGFSLN